MIKKEEIENRDKREENKNKRNGKWKVSINWERRMKVNRKRGGKEKNEKKRERKEKMKKNGNIISFSGEIKIGNRR